MAIIANFKNGETKVYTKSVYQYDKNQRLIFVGMELPNEFEVHFSIHRDGDIGTAHSATPEGVIIPNEYLATGEYIYAWLFLNGTEGGATKYTVVIPVIKRSNAVPVEFGTNTKGFTLDDDHTLVVIPN